MNTIKTLLSGFTESQLQDMKTFLLILEREKIPVSSFMDFMNQEEIRIQEIKERDKKATKEAPRHCGSMMMLVSDPVEPKDSFWECKVCRETILNEGLNVEEVLEKLAKDYNKKQLEK